jgi:hypothetical protein
MENTAADALSQKNTKVADFLSAEYVEYKRLLTNTFAEFLKNNPIFVGLNWKQFTQNFNDGDACTFSVYNLEPRLIPADQRNLDEDDQYDDIIEIYSERCALDEGLTKEDYKALEDLRTVFEAIPEDFMKQMFGDGFEVDYTSEGFTIEEYSHD